jgi:hypothetical protein
VKPRAYGTAEAFKAALDQRLRPRRARRPGAMLPCGRQLQEAHHPRACRERVAIRAFSMRPEALLVGAPSPLPSPLRPGSASWQRRAPEPASRPTPSRRGPGLRVRRRPVEGHRPDVRAPAWLSLLGNHPATPTCGATPRTGVAAPTAVHWASLATIVIIVARFPTDQQRRTSGCLDTLPAGAAVLRGPPPALAVVARPLQFLYARNTWFKGAAVALDPEERFALPAVPRLARVRGRGWGRRRAQGRGCGPRQRRAQ